MNIIMDFIYGFNWFVLFYFITLNGFYFLLLFFAAIAVYRYNCRYHFTRGIKIPQQFIKPFSLLIPAYNEESVIVDSVRSFLALDFREFEIIVANDGSTDQTLKNLIEVFKLEPVDIEINYRYRCKPIRAVYFSGTDPRLVVIDKENGGKADAQNAGANLAHYPYIGAVDSDSMLSQDSMRKLMQHFASAPSTVAVGGIVRPMNGSVIENGEIKEVRMPLKLIEQIQVVEYLRAFLYGRMGWSHLNILMIISGAFGVFRQDIMAGIGGWNSKSIGEDMDAVMRLHRYLKENNLPFRLAFAPDPVCWTQVPDTLAGLAIQRDRWQRGLMQTLLQNMGLMFNPRYQRIGMIGFPYFFFYEMLSCIVEFLALPVILFCLCIHMINWPFFVMFIFVALVWGMCVSAVSVALSETSYRRFTGSGDLGKLLFAAFLENFGYRQLHAWWRFKGFFKYIFRIKSGWGTIKRTQFSQTAGK